MLNNNHLSNNIRFLLGIILNVGFIIVELFYGFRANSMALIADAVHNISDVLGIGLIWFSQYLATRSAPTRFTYGYKNVTIFAAFLNIVFLFVAVGNIIIESIQRFNETIAITSLTIIIVASIGVLINGVTAFLFLQNNNRDIGMQSLFLNMALDAGISVCVVFGGIFMWWQGWYWLDPTLSLFIAVAILFGFMSLFKETINLIFQAVPSSIDLNEVAADIMRQSQVNSYHDLHVWPLSTTETALSVHVVAKYQEFDPDLVHHLSALFKEKYGIEHSTIQMEVTGKPSDGKFNC